MKFNSFLGGMGMEEVKTFNFNFDRNPVLLLTLKTTPLTQEMFCFER